MGDPTTARVPDREGRRPRPEPRDRRGRTRTRNVAAGGKLDFATVCPDSTMTAIGSYRSTGYRLDGSIAMEDGGDTTVLETHIVAKRLKDQC